MAYKPATKPLSTVFWLLLFLFTLGSGDAFAQQFSVKRFTTLPNDVGAFINPVRDLNGEACAVIKVEASSDFVFSSPLGIVKRKDDVGEIWIYLPKGTKMLTIKHPQWGVLRDYKFPKPLESHVTYQLSLQTPQLAETVKHDTIVLTKTITDTIAVVNHRPKLPLTTHMLLTSAFHKDGPSFGLMFAMLRRFGFFVHGQTDFHSIGSTAYTCDKEGSISEIETTPYYSGATRHSNYAFTAGLIHRLGGSANLFYGAGYGRAATAWELSESEGGGYALNEGLTHKGLAVEAGFMLHFGRLSVSASALTVAGKQWHGVIGVGLNLGGK